MVSPVQLDPQASEPLYRQLYREIRRAISTGEFAHGQKLPPTRELAGQLGLNRTTVAAAYELLEADGLIRGHVGRGSFVEYARPERAASRTISFSSSRPSEREFPMGDFEATAREVIAGPRAVELLQLGSPAGYGPLREYLLAGNAAAGDDIMITSGCQQALDLLQRTMAPAGSAVIVEDPVYPGVKNVFARPGIDLLGVPMSRDGIDRNALAKLLDERKPKLLIVTPNFQNPTGATMPVDARREVLRLARSAGATVVENDIYGELRLTGARVPTLKELDDTGSVILLRSFSKIAFPGLRVGWVIAPAPVISKLADARHWCDLHTDQLSQAILLRFAQSGRLQKHLERMRESGRLRLKAMLDACRKYLPPGTEYTRPEGGMSLWVRLPGALDAAALLDRARRENVTYLPGTHFSVAHHDPATLRLSFGSLTSEEIETGLSILGGLFTDEAERTQSPLRFETASAIV